MAIPDMWHGVNRTLVAPPGAENILPLPTFFNGSVSVSCWVLSEAELEEIKRTGRVFIGLIHGDMAPQAVIVGSEDSVRECTLDFGAVWKKEKSYGG